MSPNARATLLMIVSLMPATSLAFQLSPEGTAEERKLTGATGSWVTKLEVYSTHIGLKQFGDPVHEEITNRIYGCNGGSNICGGLDATKAPAAVLAGVRWNDDPPFRLSPSAAKNTSCKTQYTVRFQTQPRCWFTLFKDANRRAAAGEFFDAESRSAMLYRTHFGDLQYLHAMASRNGEDPAATRERIIAWFAFSWSVAIGEQDIATELRESQIPAIKDAFGNTEWTAQELWTLGSPGLRRYIRDVAFGSLLHTLQDSFAEGHADRGMPDPKNRCELGNRGSNAPGVIREFHAYGLQDHKLHSESDGIGAFTRHLQDSPNVVDIGRILLDAPHASIIPETA
jgi:hypothetical protein